MCEDERSRLTPRLTPDSCLYRPQLSLPQLTLLLVRPPDYSASCLQFLFQTQIILTAFYNLCNRKGSLK